ncbi:MAG: TRAP transporter TatT component family protein [Spirochaetaceae bacterium]|nr:TRAP transporter TatT component family protein [Spirochaetaceae bacterium]
MRVAGDLARPSGTLRNATARRGASRRAGLVLAGLFVVLALPGCSVQRLAARASAGLVADSFAAVNAEYDLELAAGGAAAGLPLLEGVLRGDPDAVDVRLLAAEAYSGYALAFVEQDDPARAVGLYRRARDHALHAWRVAARHGGVAEPADRLWFDLDALDRYLAGLEPRFVPAVYWTAQGWGGMVKNRPGDPELVADVPVLQALGRFVLRHDPAFGYAGAHVLLGALSGSMPAILGGAPAARDHFEAALRLTGRRFLMTHVLYAATYAVQVQDRALFESLLDEVRGADLDLLPERRLANAVAQQRAGRLARAVDELFQ